MARVVHPNLERAQLLAGDAGEPLHDSALQHIAYPLNVDVTLMALVRAVDTHQKRVVNKRTKVYRRCARHGVTAIGGRCGGRGDIHGPSLLPKSRHQDGTLAGQCCDIRSRGDTQNRHFTSHPQIKASGTKSPSARPATSANE